MEKPTEDYLCCEQQLLNLKGRITRIFFDIIYMNIKTFNVRRRWIDNVVLSLMINGVPEIYMRKCIHMYMAIQCV